MAGRTGEGVGKTGADIQSGQVPARAVIAAFGPRGRIAARADMATTISGTCRFHRSPEFHLGEIRMT
jgi:hypothetical protein